jgi:hypothetical protein
LRLLAVEHDELQRLLEHGDAEEDHEGEEQRAARRLQEQLEESHGEARDEAAHEEEEEHVVAEVTVVRAVAPVEDGEGGQDARGAA